MISGINGIIASYLITISVFFWVFKEKGSRLAVIIFIPFCLWYSLVLIFSINSLYGYPSSQSMPEDSVVKSIHINEPSKDYAGVMCFWVIPLAEMGNGKIEPRAYKIKYDRELHNRLMRKRQEGGKNGILVWNRKDGKSKEGLMSLKKLMGGPYYPSESGEFKIINPMILLQKETKVEIGTESQCDGICE